MVDFNDPESVVYLVGILVPLLVGVVSKKVASRRVKAVLNAVLSAIAGSTAYLVAVDGGYDFVGFVNSAVGVFIVSIATYYGLWKPTGAAEGVQNKTSGVGIS